MVGIKERVEGRVTPAYVPYVQAGLWLVVFLVYLGATIGIVAWRSWRRAVLLAVAAAPVTLAPALGRPPLWVDAVAAIAACCAWSWAHGRIPRRAARPGTLPSPAARVTADDTAGDDRPAPEVVSVAPATYPAGSQADEQDQFGTRAYQTSLGPGSGRPASRSDVFYRQLSLFVRGRIGKLGTVYAGKRRRPVGMGASRAGDVFHPYATRKKGVRNQRAVTAPGNGLSAHDSDPRLLRQVQQLVEACGELGGLHVIGKPAERKAILHTTAIGTGTATITFTGTKSCWSFSLARWTSPP